MILWKKGQSHRTADWLLWLSLWSTVPFQSAVTNVVSLNPVLYTTVYDKVCQWFATGQWFSPG
jgi:hypothetical protein